jgi:hypothetical protein
MDSVFIAATWFWLIIPAIICLGWSVWQYWQEQAHMRSRKRPYKLESKPE